MDGPTAEVHDRFRGVPGVFGWTLDAWQAGRELGLKVQINTTVTGHNLADLADIAALVSRLGAVSWSAFLLVSTGRSALLPALNAQLAEDVLNFVYDAGEFVPARTTEAHHFRRVVIQREILSRCGADHVVIAVDVQYLGLVQFGGRGDDQVRDRAPVTVAAVGGEHPLDLQRAVQDRLGDRQPLQRPLPS